LFAGTLSRARTDEVALLPIGAITHTSLILLKVDVVQN
jgi:hypothetical protein